MQTKAVIQVNHSQIYYEQKTGGPKTLIFLHPSSSSCSIWEHQWLAPEFAPYSCIRLDLPGHGQSSHSQDPEKEYTLKSIGEQLQAFITELSIDEYIIITLSISANFIAEVAPQLQKCKGFFMAGAPITAKDITPVDILQPFEFGDVLFTPEPVQQRLENYISNLILTDAPQMLWSLLTDFKRTDKAYRKYMGQCIQLGQWSDEAQQLCQAGKPVALVYGREEKIIKKDYLLTVSLPKWQHKIHIMDQAGHLCNLDQPKLFNHYLSDFAKDIFQ